MDDGVYLFHFPRNWLIGWHIIETSHHLKKTDKVIHLKPKRNLRKNKQHFLKINITQNNTCYKSVLLFFVKRRRMDRSSFTNKSMAWRNRRKQKILKLAPTWLWRSLQLIFISGKPWNKTTMSCCKNTQDLVEAVYCVTQLFWSYGLIFKLKQILLDRNHASDWHKAIALM